VGFFLKIYIFFKKKEMGGGCREGEKKGRVWWRSKPASLDYFLYYYFIS
jgi:hypothetical protein